MSAPLRTLFRAGTLPPLAHVAELSSTYLMNIAEPASLHLSLPLLCRGSESSAMPAHTAGCVPICGGVAALPSKLTEEPVRFEVCQKPFQIIPAEPALKALRSASTGSLGWEYLVCASFIHVRALTPASLFHVALVPSSLNSAPPFW